MTRRVLVVRLSAMGDVAMTAPVVAAVCAANPTVQFDVLSTAFFEPFFERLPNLRFVGTDIRKEGGGVVALWRLSRRLQGLSAGYGLVVDLHDVLRTKLLRAMLRLSGSHVFVVDKGRRAKRELVSGARRVQLEPMADRYADVFRRAGLAVPAGRRLRAKMPLPQGLGVVRQGGEIWIGVAPFAQHRGKMYPAEKMRSVVDLLLAHPGVRIFLFGGGASERREAEAIAAGRGRCHVLIGKMSLHDEMAVMSNLDVMLSMDSSAMHVASLYGVRVVSIWGATHPYAGFLGQGQSEDDCLQRSDLDCRPCSVFGNRPCRWGDYRCFEIAPGKVVARVLRDA